MTMRNKWINSIYIVSGIIMLTITGCSFSEDLAYEQAKQKQTKEAYSDFLTSFPESTRAPALRKHIAMLEKREAEEKQRKLEEKQKRETMNLELCAGLQRIIGMSGEDAAKTVNTLLDEDSRIKKEVVSFIASSGDTSKKNPNADIRFSLGSIEIKFTGGKVASVEITKETAIKGDFGRCTRDYSTNAILSSYSGLDTGRPLKLVKSTTLKVD